VRLLLDTHVALWAITDDARLPARIRALIENPQNDIVVSAATIWEIAIKHALSRGRPTDMPLSGEEAVMLFQRFGYELLSITPRHASAVETLPPHHGDPFDRLLVAQALTEPLRLVSHDPAIARYGELVIAF
jgi:PIN domain nuclease of toxin-antitoxin system